MYQLIKIFSVIFVLIFSTNIFSQTKNTLEGQRLTVMQRYVTLLGQGDYQTIPKLFAANAAVISSTGAVDNPQHFYKNLFTKTISQPQSKFINIFIGNIDKDMMASYFIFSWVNIHGKKVAAKFLDLFIFEKNSQKIKRVYIFSNTFKEEIMKQLE